MSKVIATSQWVVFFTKAGLPQNVAANYALIFSNNRIQLDMLLELSKEYLYDMGIKIMGDVIAILRYAKEFHNQLSKERMFGGTSLSSQTTKSPAERIVGHYARRFSPVQSPASQAGIALPQKANIISLKRPEPKEIKRIRRVPPEEEGAYKIKMPSGTTKRTRQILQQQQQQQLKKQISLGSKRSVFARLGDSAVSSSTDSTKGAMALQQPSSSVFERLGPNKASDDTPTSTVFTDDILKRGSALPYKGVLKMTVGKNRTVVSNTPMKGPGRTVIKPRMDRFQNITKTIKLNQINSILTSNEKTSPTFRKTITAPGSRGIFGRNASQRLGVKGRLGNKVVAQNIANKKNLLKSRMTTKVSSNVFSRLGK